MGSKVNTDNVHRHSAQRVMYMLLYDVQYRSNFKWTMNELYAAPSQSFTITSDRGLCTQHAIFLFIIIFIFIFIASQKTRERTFECRV